MGLGVGFYRNLDHVIHFHIVGRQSFNVILLPHGLALHHLSPLGVSLVVFFLPTVRYDMGCSTARHTSVFLDTVFSSCRLGL